MIEVTFPFEFHPAFRLPAAAVGVVPRSTRVTVADERLEVRFGPWVVSAPLDDVVGASVSGPYAWPKVIGAPHVSLADRGLTFATNPRAGVCIRFDRPVRGIDPWGVIRHPALTVTVRDAPALAELLDRSGHHPERTHTGGTGATAEDLVEETVGELSSLSAGELRRRARERGVPNASRLNKAELVAALSPVVP